LTKTTFIRCLGLAHTKSGTAINHTVSYVGVKHEWLTF